MQSTRRPYGHKGRALPFDVGVEDSSCTDVVRWASLRPGAIDALARSQLRDKGQIRAIISIAPSREQAVPERTCHAADVLSTPSEGIDAPAEVGAQ